MDGIRRLIRIAARRNSAGDYTELRLKVLRSLAERLRARLSSEGISMNAVVEALVSGYVNQHPGALALVDDWVRENAPEADGPAPPILTNRDLDEIYAAAKCDMIEEE